MFSRNEEILTCNLKEAIGQPKFAHSSLNKVFEK